MIPSTIARIVAAAGGPDAFAAAVRVKPRFVYYLLAGQRGMSPRTEELANSWRHHWVSHWPMKPSRGGASG